jgi:hypothetical protein
MQEHSDLIQTFFLTLHINSTKANRAKLKKLIRILVYQVHHKNRSFLLTLKSTAVADG